MLEDKKYKQHKKAGNARAKPGAHTHNVDEIFLGTLNRIFLRQIDLLKPAEIKSSRYKENY